nr:unnamed protein product [Spirometra erinaceieuropaei]
MHPTSSTSGKSDLNLAQSFGRLPGCMLSDSEVVAEQEAVFSLMELLEKDPKGKTIHPADGPLRSLLEKHPPDYLIHCLLKYFETDALAAVKIIGTLLSRISCPDCVHDSSISELLLFLQSKVLQVSRPLTRDFTPPKSLLHYGQIALNCLQTRSLPSALEKLAPILEFVVALSNFSGETGTSKPDRNNSPSDSQLPLRLLMVTATIELRLRLSTAMNTTEVDC